MKSPSAMHVTCWRGIPKEGKDCRKLTISEKQYEILVAYVSNSFQKNQRGDFLLNPAKGYHLNDRFYEAKGSYNFVQTCNFWVNKGLKKMSIRTAIWSPFDWGIFWHL